MITISALPSVAQKWLLPLVLEWMALNPDTEIRIEASHAKINFNHSASDMCLSFGEEGYIGLHKQKCLIDNVTMVVSPVLLADHLNLNDLLKLPMIHIDWGDDNDNLPQWNEWLAKVTNESNQSDIQIQRGPKFTHPKRVTR